MRKPIKKRSPRRVRGGCAPGFTLIENMVALAIFAIGMMGVVYTLLTGMGLSRTSQSLTQAYVAMQEIVSMMRADALEISQYTDVDTSRPSSLPSSSSVAGKNVATWIQSLKKLPGSGTAAGGYGRISIKSAAGVPPGSCPCDAKITITWAGGRKSYVVETMVGY